MTDKEMQEERGTKERILNSTLYLSGASFTTAEVRLEIGANHGACSQAMHTLRKKGLIEQSGHQRWCKPKPPEVDIRKVTFLGRNAAGERVGVPDEIR